VGSGGIESSNKTLRSIFDQTFFKSLFGNIKHNLKFREFLTRGIEKVRVEHNLACNAHNLKVIWGKLERNVPIIGTIRTLVANSRSKVVKLLRVHTVVNFNCQC
jgi:hypothetical protein